MKLADITFIFKKKGKNFAENYRPVNLFSTVSKIFERIMQKQANVLLVPFSCRIFVDIEKGFSTQYALLTLLERRKSCLNKKVFCGAIFKNLSKAFDTINHELLVAKLLGN